MQLYYIPQLHSQRLEIGQSLALPEEESQHIIKVMRHKVGDIISLTDGKGNLLETQIVVLGKKDCLVRIEKCEFQPIGRSYRIHLAVAPTKNIDRFEWFLEKATEMGIDEITPLICKHSIRREMKVERSERIITAAMKQSLQLYHPQLNEAISLDKFLNHEIEGKKIIAHLCPETQLRLSQQVNRDESVCILIGPEGDFSPEEVQLALQKGFNLALLGTQRLRTETAALVACNQIHFINEAL